MIFYEGVKQMEVDFEDQEAIVQFISSQNSEDLALLQAIINSELLSRGIRSPEKPA